MNGPTERERELEAQRDMLAQAIWDARGILGFDNDGDATPAATIAGGGYESFADWCRWDAQSARRDDDEARARAAVLEQQIAAIDRALDDEEANLADDGARLSHSVVRRLRAILAAGVVDNPTEETT